MEFDQVNFSNIIFSLLCNEIGVYVRWHLKEIS